MKRVTRRNFVWSLLGIAGIGGSTAWFYKNSILRWLVRRTYNEGLELSAAPKVAEDLCVLTSEQVEGPFFITSPMRKDIQEDRKGKQMNLKLQVVRAPVCAPIEGAIVEIWHCDAEGIYSGYPEDIAHDLWKTFRVVGINGKNVQPLNEARFLRGAQQTDGNGSVEFHTIFPGWYEPRAPHIHFKVWIDHQELLTSQFYFEPEFCRRIYTHHEPYRLYGDSPYTSQNDVAMKQHLNARGLLIRPEWSENAPLEASARVGIRTSA